MTQGDITEILLNWENNRQEAINQLMPVVYQELHKLAASYLRRERSGHTLQPTALIHEVYVRLIRQDAPGWKDSAHFFGVAAQMMRQVLVDCARKYRSAKRGGGQNISLEDLAAAPLEQCDVLLPVNEAMERLRESDARKCEVLELRYFGGMTREEIAEALGVSVGTVKRDLLLGEAWLRSAMATPAVQASGPRS